MKRALVALVAGLAATAGATAPCFDVCHLSQGQPLLVDGEIWVRPCSTANGKQTCVLQRLDTEGRVVATLPGDDIYKEDAFEQKYLENRKVARIVYQSAWTDLRKPYTLSLETATMTLRLEKSTLVCERSSGTIKRPLACKPTALSVRAASIGRDSKPEDPSGIAVIVATCGTREVIAVCQAKPSGP